MTETAAQETLSRVKERGAPLYNEDTKTGPSRMTRVKERGAMLNEEPRHSVKDGDDKPKHKVEPPSGAKQRGQTLS